MRRRRFDLLTRLSSLVAIVAMAVLLSGCPVSNSPDTGADPEPTDPVPTQPNPTEDVVLAVQVDGSGIVEQEASGTRVTLNAIPDAGWVFSEWFGSTSSTENPLSIVAVAAETVIGARFELAPEPDTDLDGVADDEDRCPDFDDAKNADGDGLPDDCDECPNDADNDADNDGVCGDVDNCPTAANDDQADGDGDGLGDACDVCPQDDPNDSDDDGVCDSADECLGFDDTKNADGDEFPDGCDECPDDANNDADDDDVCGNVDNCPSVPNPLQTDSDGDGEGDACENTTPPADTDSDDDGLDDSADQCPNTPAEEVDQIDANGCGPSELPDTNDADNDGITDEADNCPNVPNFNQRDGDDNGVGDCCDTDDWTDGDSDGWTDANGCDPCPEDPDNDLDGDGICYGECVLGSCVLCTVEATPDNPRGWEFDCCPNDADNDGDFDGLCADVDPCPVDPQNDIDNDGICPVDDNCPDMSNADQADADEDGIGDVCDNCPAVHNADQADDNGDGVGDVCASDTDEDGVDDRLDNCPQLANADQINRDGDSHGDACDNCPSADNEDQADDDDDGLGDACDICMFDADNDADNDGVCGDVDQCPSTPPGDVHTVNDAGCGSSERDTDGDGVTDNLDECEGTEPGVAVDETGCPTAPLLDFSFPTENVVMLQNEELVVEYSGQIQSLDATRATVTLFIDDDTDATNGITVVVATTIFGHNSVNFDEALPTDLAGGIYHIGGSIADDVGEPVVVYLSTTLQVVDPATVTVLTPSSNMLSPAPAAFDISWETNLPVGITPPFTQPLAAIDVIAVGPSTYDILTSADLSQTTATFQVDELGTYEISVIVNLRNNTQVTATAPGTATVFALLPARWSSSRPLWRDYDPSDVYDLGADGNLVTASITLDEAAISAFYPGLPITPLDTSIPLGVPTDVYEIDVSKFGGGMVTQTLTIDTFELGIQGSTATLKFDYTILQDEQPPGTIDAVRERTYKGELTGTLSEDFTQITFSSVSGNLTNCTLPDLNCSETLLENEASFADDVIWTIVP